MKKKTRVMLAVITMTILTIFGINDNVGARKIKYTKNDAYKYGEIWGNAYERNKGEYKKGKIDIEVVKDNAEQAKENIDSDIDVDEVIDKEISKQCLYRAACDKGFEISNDEARKIAKEQRASVNDSDEYNQVKEFIRGAGMTEDEYWDSMIIQYKMSESINNYLSYVESSELKDCEKLDTEDYQNKILQIDKKIRQKAIKKYKRSIVK